MRARGFAGEWVRRVTGAGCGRAGAVGRGDETTHTPHATGPAGARGEVGRAGSGAFARVLVSIWNVLTPGSGLSILATFRTRLRSTPPVDAPDTGRLPRSAPLVRSCSRARGGDLPPTSPHRRAPVGEKRNLLLDLDGEGGRDGIGIGDGNPEEEGLVPELQRGRWNELGTWPRLCPRPPRGRSTSHRVRTGYSPGTAFDS